MTLGLEWQPVEDRLQELWQRYPGSVRPVVEKMQAALILLRSDSRFDLVEKGVSHCWIRFGFHQVPGFLLLGWSEEQGFAVVLWTHDEGVQTVWNPGELDAVPDVLHERLAELKAGP